MKSATLIREAIQRPAFDECEPLLFWVLFRVNTPCSNLSDTAFRKEQKNRGSVDRFSVFGNTPSDGWR